MSKHYHETDGGRAYHVFEPRVVELRKGDRVALSGTVIGLGSLVVEVLLDNHKTSVFVDVRDVMGGRQLRAISLPERAVSLPEHEPHAPAEIDGPQMEGV